MASVMPLATTIIQLPYRYAPRSYSAQAIAAWRAGARRMILLWHRRASKSSTAVQIVIEAAATVVGVYWIVTPTYALGRRVYWDGLTHDGQRLLLGYIPPELVTSVSENEMQVILRNGSVLQIVGADKPDLLARGPGVRGVVFDEYSAMSSDQPWQIVRPILMENNAWAVFCFTPLGRNHASKLWDMAVSNPEWWTSRLTVADTKRDAPGEDGSPVVSSAVIERERAAGMPDDMIAQEFMLSFNASLPGAYYARELQRAEAEGRIGPVPWSAQAAVHTVMDLGVGNKTVILFFQCMPGGAVHIIDVQASTGEGVAYWANRLQTLQRERRWTYGQHFAPHDAGQRGRNDAVTTERAHANLGIRLTVLERIAVDIGIQAARGLFPRIRFDQDTTRELLYCLAHHRSAWSEERQVLALHPVHDWTSDHADSFRYLALAVQGAERRVRQQDRPRGKTKVDFDPFNPFNVGRH